MTFAEYLVRAGQRAADNRLDYSERVGQAYFNELYAVRQDLAGKVIGKPFDPFYNDGNLGEFLSWVGENW